MRAEELSFDIFKSFVSGQIESSDVGSSYVLTILAILNQNIYYKAGYSPKHSGMLDDLEKAVSEVTYAGRIGQLHIPSKRLDLIHGGNSIKGYQSSNSGKGFVVATFNGYLEKLGDERRLV